ncbi:hypothetical protein D3C72_2284560 [compost metagenome]
MEANSRDAKAARSCVGKKAEAHPGVPGQTAMEDRASPARVMKPALSAICISASQASRDPKNSRL